jgi:hypothetical protein
VHYDAEAIDAVPVDVFLQTHKEPPQQIVIDLDTTYTRPNRSGGSPGIVFNW